MPILFHPRNVYAILMLGYVFRQFSILKTSYNNSVFRKSLTPIHCFKNVIQQVTVLKTSYANSPFRKRLTPIDYFENVVRQFNVSKRHTLFQSFENVLHQFLILKTPDTNSTFQKHLTQVRYRGRKFSLEANTYNSMPMPKRTHLLLSRSLQLNKHMD